VSVPCDRCHARERYQIPSRCSACHLKDDKHRRRLGDVCSNCHTEKSWKDVDKFDHQKTSFPLTGKHSKVRCSQCHQNPLFKGTSSFCNDCHAKDDYHKGDFGKKCDSCHDASSWKRERFNHAKETGYPLEGKHRDVKCNQCHTRPIFSGKISRMCVTCHRKDDPHDGELGSRCDICHSVVGFKVIKRMSFGGAFPAGLIAAHRRFPEQTGRNVSD
ncbi:MAG TPA: cytochrome C, partial [Nitrospiria bacterium]|nr:cytochrome C [Nitrospiria bacterium]